MAEFNVTISDLLTKADTLEGLNNQRFEQELSGLEQLEGSLNGMWEGDARKAFHQAFTNDMGQMRNLQKAVTDYITVLRNTAAEYAKAESTNVDTANQRTYG